MEDLLEYEGLIYSIINKYTKKYDKDDLYQVGMIGLIDAYKHFDSSYQTKFSSFAYYYIIGEVNKYIRENSGLKVSKDYVLLKKKINNAREVMEQKLGREPSNLEISLYLDIDLEILEKVLLVTDSIKSIDEIDNVKTYDDISYTIMDLRNEINKLSDEEKELLKARYYDEFTQMETSQKLGISQVQVSRKENRVLQKLKTRL